MTFFFGGWMKCEACSVLWDCEYAGNDCWCCGKPGERAYRPGMACAATWYADRNDPLPNAA